MYPMLKEFVEPGTYVGCDESDVIGYYVENAKGDEFKISQELYEVLFDDDGTHPLQPPNGLIRQLKKEGIITTSRFILGHILSQFIVILFGRGVCKLRPLCRVIAVILSGLSLLTLPAGIVLLLHFSLPKTRNISISVYYAAIFLSVTLMNSATLSPPGHPATYAYRSSR